MAILAPYRHTERSDPVFALVPIALFLFPEAYKVPGAVISLILAVILTVIFTRNYHKTKAWLSEHA
jgi:hypothetical protein